MDAFRRELDRIVDEIGQRFEQEVTVSMQFERTVRRPVVVERDALVFGGGFVVFDDVVGDRGEIHEGETLLTRVGLDPGNAQQRIECVQEAARLDDRVVDGRRIVRLGPCAPLGSFEPREQASERRAQVVRDRVAYALDLVHQPLDLVEHAVDDAHEPSDVVVLRMHRQAPAQVAGHDLLDRVRDRN
ncbi:hypothetical protein OKW42_007246 [Paraburkholderia sp. WC7.3d]